MAEKGSNKRVFMSVLKQLLITYLVFPVLIIGMNKSEQFDYHQLENGIEKQLIKLAITNKNLLDESHLSTVFAHVVHAKYIYSNEFYIQKIVELITDILKRTPSDKKNNAIEQLRKPFLSTSLAMNHFLPLAKTIASIKTDSSPPQLIILSKLAALLGLNGLEHIFFNYKKIVAAHNDCRALIKLLTQQ